MAYKPTELETHGDAHLKSDHFFDYFEIPPWDTWVSFLESDLEQIVIAYVPASHISNANEGICSSTTNCIRWIETSHPLLKLLDIAENGV